VCLLADRLQQALTSASAANSSVAVVYLDLDGFKAVNDNMGHGRGDELLVALAQRIKEVPCAKATRWPGSAVTSSWPCWWIWTTGPRLLEPVLERLLKAAATPVNGFQFPLIAGVGILPTVFLG
jgi:hypothetical protein